MADADALFTNFNASSEPLESIIDAVGPETHFIFATDQNGINSGVGLFRASPTAMQLLRDAYDAAMLNTSLNVRWLNRRA